MLDIIDKHEGKRKGKNGITIHILKQKSNERSRSITIHGLTIDQLFQKILFYLKSLKLSEDGSEIIIKTKHYK